jgi:hypothetical protein
MPACYIGLFGGLARQFSQQGADIAAYPTVPVTVTE